MNVEPNPGAKAQVNALAAAANALQVVDTFATVSTVTLSSDSGVTLHGARFSHANCRYTSFRGAWLAGAIFECPALAGARRHPELRRRAGARRKCRSGRAKRPERVR